MIPPMILLCFCKAKVAVTLCKISPKACLSLLPLYHQSPGLVSACVNQLNILYLTIDDLINYYSSHLSLLIKLKHLFWVLIFRQLFNSSCYFQVAKVTNLQVNVVYIHSPTIFEISFREFNQN